MGYVYICFSPLLNEKKIGKKKKLSASVVFTGNLLSLLFLECQYKQNGAKQRTLVKHLDNND